MRRLTPTNLLIVLACCLPVVMLLTLFVGTMPLSLDDAWQAFSGNEAYARQHLILTQIRLPRILLATGTGCVLAICGAATQGLFRNPLADPSLIGVSAGASAGASFVIVFVSGWLTMSGWMGLSLIAVGAFIGGAIAVMLVYRLASSVRGTSVATMLLAGIAITAVAGALNSLFSFLADNDMLRRISLWQMGSLDSADWPRVIMMSCAAALICTQMPRYATALNAILLGESEARHLGVDVENVKQKLIIYTAIGVGVSVATSGMIAFVGLVVPHIVRLLIGPDHRALLPASALAGAILMLVADAVARVVIAPAELPAGILTALVGAPFFFALLLSQRADGMRY
ncbi:MAG: iron ABC transporter permease [Pseudomonadales bacterium]